MDRDEEPASGLARDLRVPVGRLHRRLRQQATMGDLTPSQLSALLQVEKHGAGRVSALACSEGMRPQSMAPIVAALEADVLVRGVPDPDDGRQMLFSPSPSCLDRIRQGRNARQDWLSGALRQSFSAGERSRLPDAVGLLHGLVNA